MKPLFVNNYQLLKILILSILILPLRGQGGLGLSWPTIRYTIRNGLTGMQCMSVFKDNRGAVWVGTKTGLSRFNGEKFEKFGLKDGLLGEYVTVVGQDPQGYVWFNCQYHGLVRFDGQHFKQYPNIIPPNNDFMAKMEQDGTILIHDVQNASKVYQLKNDTLRLFSWVGVPTNIQQKVRRISLTKNKGEYLIETSNALWLYKNQQLRLLAKGDFVFDEPSFVHGDVFVKARRADTSYDTWIWNGQSLQRFMTTTAKTITGKTVRDFKIVRQLGYDYVFNFDGSMYLLEKRSSRYSVIYADNPSNDVSYQDSPDKPDAIRYIATEKGLLGLVKNGFKSFSESAVPYAWSVAEDKSGNYWFLNFGNSLQKYDGHTITEITDYPKKIVDNQWYYHALRDKLGHSWLPSAYGILHYDGQHYTHLLKTEKTAMAFALAENKAQNTVAACTYNGVFMIDTRPPYKYRIQADTGRIFKNLVGCAAVSPNDGAYWFSGYGLARYDSLKHQTVYYNRDNKKIDAGSIMSLFFDNRGTLWAGSVYRGLFRFNAQKDVFERVFGRWLTGMVPFVEQLDADHLLIADQYNLYAVSLKDTTQVRCFNHNNGFMGTETGQLGSYRDSKGQIWLMSGSVLSVLDPAQLDLQPAAFRVSIVQVSRGDSLPIRVPFVGKSQSVALLFGQNSVSFTVEALGEDKPFETQYSYRVKGFLNDWSAWQTQDLVALTNLPNGTFTLEVKARRGMLASESAVVKLDFEVSMYFWLSPNFYKYASLVGLFLLAIAIYLGYRQRRYNHEILAQNKKIKDKEQEVRFLQVQTIQAQMHPHFTFNVLGSIQNLIESSDFENAGANIVKLSALIRNYLEASLMGNGSSNSLYDKEIPLGDEINLLKMYVEFEQLQYKNRIEYELTIADDLVPDNYRIPPLILQPFVENAIKHGLLYRESGGKVWIKFTKIDDETLQCVIEDDGVGRGRAAELQQASLRIYKSRGTELVKNRVHILNEMGYKINIQTNDRPGGGTVVVVLIGYT
jgi:ligand-binding sensor domain-containing protein